jgi:tetraacyldisaccharide-1-P 4'-kinase
VLHDVAGLSTDTVGILAFEDHHVFTERDARAAVRRASGRPIVVTEKDAVKLAPFADMLGETWVLTQRLEWDWGEDAVRARLEEIAASPPRGSTPGVPMPPATGPRPTEEPT